VARLIAIVRDDKDERVPDMARQVLRVIADQLDDLETRVAAIEVRIMAWHKTNPVSQRLATIPSIGPIIATAIAATVAEPSVFPVAGSLPPGLVSCRGRTPPAARHASAGSANEATAISGAC
jgi:transposase